MVRAVIEGVSYSLYSCLCVLKEMGILIDNMSVCGGGGKSFLWRKMLADLYAMTVNTMQSDEGSALGAAVLGGCAADIYTSVEDGCRQMVRNNEFIDFNSDNHTKYLKYYEVYQGLYPALKGSFEMLMK